MTSNPPGGPGEPGGEQQPGPPRPWFPPAPVPPPGEPAQPAPGPGGYGQPEYGGYGQPGYGGYGQGYGGHGQAGAGTRPYGTWPPPPQAPKPGVIPLRPLGVGEILDGAFTSIRRNPRATLGIAAVLLTLSGIVTASLSVALIHSMNAITFPAAGQTLTQSQANRLLSSLLDAFLPLIGVSLVLSIIVDLVLTGLFTVVIGRSVLGHQITAGEAWRIARPRLPALLGVTLLIACIIFGPWIVLGLLIALMAVGHAPGGLTALVVTVGIIAGICLSIWFAIMFRMAGPTVVLERERPAASLRRSWRLVRGSFWRVLGITLLAALIVGVTAAVLQLPFALLAAAAGGGGHTPFAAGGGLFAATGSTIAGVIISAIGGIVANSVARPISAGVAVLLYVDMRMRREGLDLVLQTATANGEPPTGDEFASLWRPGAGGPPAGPGGGSDLGAGGSRGGVGSLGGTDGVGGPEGAGGSPGGGAPPAW